MGEVSAETPPKRVFPKEEHDPKREWTAAQLREYDGVDKPMYIAVCGLVYDVSESENFFPEKGYGKLWGGRESSYSLSKMSLEEGDSNRLDWKMDSLSKIEKESLQSWNEHFAKKYPVVGVYIGYNDVDNQIDFSVLKDYSKVAQKGEPVAKKKEPTEAAAS